MNIALKYGVWAAGLISFWNILNLLFLYKTPLSKIAFFINLIVLLTLLYRGIVSIKLKQYNKEITFGNAALAGIKITLITAILLSIITYFYSSIPNISYETYIVEETKKAMIIKNMKDIDATINDLKLGFLPERQAQSTFIFTTAIGIVFSFIYAMIIRNKVHEPIKDI